MEVEGDPLWFILTMIFKIILVFLRYLAVEIFRVFLVFLTFIKFLGLKWVNFVENRKIVSVIEVIEKCSHVLNRTGLNPSVEIDLRDLLNSINSMAITMEALEKVAPQYDISEKIQGNGLRTSLFIARRMLSEVYCIVGKLSGALDSTYDDLSDVRKMMHHYGKIMEMCLDSRYVYENWATYQSINAEETIQRVQTGFSEAFYGKFIGLQFEPGFRTLAKYLTFLQASQSEGYYGATTLQAFKRAWTYFFDFKARAKRIALLFMYFDIDFFKEYAKGAVSPMFRAMVKVTNPVSVCINFKIKKEQVIVNGIEVNHPYPGEDIEGKLISKNAKEGMPVDIQEAEEKSRDLIFNIHGGGGVAYSSESEEMYLRKWTNNLNVPVYSVDYTVAPEGPFEKQTEQVFYAYCYVLSHPEEFGFTGERIIVTGNSWGCCLTMILCLNCIKHGIPLPYSIAMAYPIIVYYHIPLPSHLLSIIDPVLPYTLALTCIAPIFFGRKFAIAEPKSECKCEKCLSTPQYTILDNPHLGWDFNRYILPGELDFVYNLYSPFFNLDSSVRFPKFYILGSHVDPALDNIVVLAKELLRKERDVKVDIVGELGHAFLNLCWLNDKTKEAQNLFCKQIGEMLKR